jgi:integrase
MQDLLTDNPVRKTRLPRRGLVAEKPPIEPAKVKDLIEKLAEPSRSIAALLARTGLRIGELLALRWQDVDLQNGFLSVNQTVYEGHFDEPTTKRSKRRIPLGPQCVERLVGLKRTEATPSTLVFSARNGSTSWRQHSPAACFHRISATVGFSVTPSAPNRPANQFCISTLPESCYFASK